MASRPRGSHRLPGASSESLQLTATPSNVGIGATYTDVHPLLRFLLLLALLACAGCRLPFLAEEEPARAEVTGRVSLSDGRPAAGARVYVELMLVAPPGRADAGACMPDAVQGAGGGMTDSAGRYRVASQILLGTLEACVAVRAAVPPALVLDAPRAGVGRLRWTEPAGFARTEVNFTIPRVAP